MTSQKADLHREDALDQLGRELILAAGLETRDAEALASTPYLYARIRARIAEKQRGAYPSYEAWSLVLLDVARKAFPAMSLATMIFVVLFFFATTSIRPETGLRYEELAGDSGASRMEAIVFSENDFIAGEAVLENIMYNQSAEERR